MAQEVENYMMEKYRKGISRVHLVKSEFEVQLKPLLEKLLQEYLKSAPAETRAEFRKCLFELNNIMTDYQSLSTSRLLSLYQTKQTLNGIKQKLLDMKSELSQTQSGDAGSAALQDGRQPHSSDDQVEEEGEEEDPNWTHRFIDRRKVHGFDEDIRSLEKMVLQEGTDERFKVVGITGIAGCGKSTLARVVVAGEEVKKRFVPRIWVSMSKKPRKDSDKKTAVVERMLDALGMDEDMVNKISTNHKLQGLLSALYVQLMGKKYLIVLDDSKETEEWYKDLHRSLIPQQDKWEHRLAYGLPKGYGGTVIVTSRNDDLAKQMAGETYIHRLLPLADPDDCWKIYLDAARQDGVSYQPTNEEQERNIVTQKCIGLPLAAKLLGQNMNGQVKSGIVPERMDTVDSTTLELSL